MTAARESEPKKRPVVLVIRDGWGVSLSPPSMAKEEGNATLLARLPVHDAMLAKYPKTMLIPCGEAVGLPPGQMGNSEVGHLNLGAGRIIYQDLTRIARAIETGEFFESPVLNELISTVKARGGRLHVMGLCSDGGVHSHIHHMQAVLDLARRKDVGQVFLHCFTDGRDTSPTSGAGFVQELDDHARQVGVGTIATIVGRYFAMDRDRNWDRVKLAYDAIVHGQGVVKDDAVSAMHEWYAASKTDEFIPPTIIRNVGIDPAEQLLRDGDGVLFANFRSDRARQLTRALTVASFDGFGRGSLPKTHFVCMSVYDETFNLPVVFPPESYANILGEVLSNAGLKQLRIAETEKYAHVTFFFNGGREEPYPGEERCLVNSPKVATYDLQPEMSAYEVTQRLLDHLDARTHDVVILNYANPDMVGHSGNLPATMKSVEVIDECLGKLLAKLAELGGVALVTADHGNAEKMIENGEPFTAHTTNPVHFIYVASDYERWQLRSGILADVAPTILDILGLAIPKEMTGKSLLVPAQGK